MLMHTFGVGASRPSIQTLVWILKMTDLVRTTQFDFPLELALLLPRRNRMILPIIHIIESLPYFRSSTRYSVYFLIEWIFLVTVNA